MLEVTLKGETYTYKGDVPGAFQFLDALTQYFADHDNDSRQPQ